MTNSWSIGSIEVERVEYFDTPLPADTIGMGGTTAWPDWAGPWMADGQPLVGQAFWIIRSGGRAFVVDPCGASDPFLRTGPEAVDHQDAAFAVLAAAGHQPDGLDGVVLTHLDGIGMTALTDGGPAGEERWTPAFAGPIRLAQPDYDHVMAAPTETGGGLALAQLDQAGAVETVNVTTPRELAPGVFLRLTGAHSPGHCVIDIESAGQRAVFLGHLAVSPLNAAAGPRPDGLHMDPEAGWQALHTILTDTAETGALVFGSLWPNPGAARVESVDPFVLRPAPPD